MHEGGLYLPGHPNTPSARGNPRTPKLKPFSMARMCAVCREYLRPEHFFPDEREALHPICRMCWR
jgi:hypothetical protein